MHTPLILQHQGTSHSPFPLEKYPPITRKCQQHVVLSPLYEVVLLYNVLDSFIRY